MTQLLKLRCSRLPLNFKCGGSARPPVVAIETTSPPAELGVKVHLDIPRVAHGEIALDEIDDSEERFLIARGVEMLRVSDMVDATFEEEFVCQFEQFELSGHPDVWKELAELTARVIDFKSGRVDEQYRAQLEGYALLIQEFSRYRFTRIVTAISWLRDNEVEQYVLTADDTRAFKQRVVEEIVGWSGVYKPGDHCGFCPRAHECTARVAHDRAAVARWTNRADLVEGFAGLTPAQQVDIVAQAKEVARLADEVLKAAKRHVRENGEIVANGKRLYINETERTTIDTGAAWDVLEQAGFEHADFVRIATIGNEELKKVVGEKAEPRGKGKAIMAMMQALDDAGATTKTKQERLETRRS